DAFFPLNSFATHPSDSRHVVRQSRLKSFNSRTGFHRGGNRRHSRRSAERLWCASGTFPKPLLQRSECVCFAAMVIFLWRALRRSGVPPRAARSSFHSRDRNGFAVSFQRSGRSTV